MQDDTSHEPDGQLKVPWDDPRLLIIPGGVAGKLKDLGGEIFHHSTHVDRSSSAHPLGIVSLPVKASFRSMENV